jgi:hypothetical protein
MWTRLPVVVATVALLVAAVISCDRTSEAEREAFVLRFVESVYEGSDFSRQYLPPDYQRKVEESRPRMTSDFRIDRVDRSGFGPYEYYLKFSNGAVGVVYLSEEEGTIREAGIYVYPREDTEE